MPSKYMVMVKFIGQHEESEIVDLANAQDIPVVVGQFHTKEELVKYILDNGFDLYKDSSVDAMTITRAGEEL